MAKIPYVTWRNGRPRFESSPTLRKAGHKPHDLKTAAGDWMDERQARAWSQAFVDRLGDDRRKAGARKDKDKRAATAAVQRAIPAPPVRQSYTLGQMLEQFLREGTADNGNGASTVRTYTSAIRAIEASCPDAWFSEAAALVRRDVRGMYRLMREERTESMAHMAIVVLSIAFNWAIDNDDDDLIPGGNPAERIKMLKPGKRDRALTITEYLHLVATAERLGAHRVADMIVWGVWTAQRAGDRLSARWADIRDDRLEITQAKRKAKVSVPLAAAIRERMGRTNREPHAAIVPIDSTGPRERLNKYWRAFHKVLDEAAKTMPSLADVLDRDLRRTASTWMGRAGCTIPEIFAITGHKFRGETAIMGHYMAVDLQIADNAIRKLEAWYALEVEKLREQQERKAG